MANCRTCGHWWPSSARARACKHTSPAKPKPPTWCKTCGARGTPRLALQILEDIRVVQVTLCDGCFEAACQVCLRAPSRHAQIGERVISAGPGDPCYWRICLDCFALWPELGLDAGRAPQGQLRSRLEVGVPESERAAGTANAGDSLRDLRKAILVEQGIDGQPLRDAMASSEVTTA